MQLVEELALIRRREDAMAGQGPPPPPPGGGTVRQRLRKPPLRGLRETGERCSLSLGERAWVRGNLNSYCVNIAKTQPKAESTAVKKLLGNGRFSIALRRGRRFDSRHGVPHGHRGVIHSPFNRV